MEFMNDKIEGVGTSKNLGLAITMGLLQGYSYISKFGVNLDIDTTSDPEDIWEFGETYIYDADDTAPIAYVSCASALDVGNKILVQGQDINRNEVIQYVYTNGQSNVELETPLWRVYRMKNKSDYGGVLNDILYCHTDSAPVLGVPEDDNVRAIIDGSKGSTLMTLYTIPKGKVGFLMRGEVGVELAGNAAALAEYAHFHLESRPLGGDFTLNKAITCIVGGGASYQDDRPFPDPLPSGADIKVVADSVSQDNIGTWATMDILLVDETYFQVSYLESIEQPGYTD